MEDELAYMKGHPPRCLGGLSRSPSLELETFLAEHLGAYATIFSAVCECGAHVLEVESASSGLTEITCAGCSRARMVFDPGQHGYEGELFLREREQRPRVAKSACPECGGATCEVALAFQYSGDETEVLRRDERGPVRRLLARLARRLLGLSPTIQPEDLFGWVTCAARCEGCQAIREVMDHECA